MRILSLSNCPLDPTLGSGKTVLRWTNGLREHGHQCRVLGSNELLPPRWRKLPGRRFWLALNAARVLRREIRSFKPDLVEFYGAEFGYATYRAARARHRPLLVAHTNGLELLAHASLPAKPKPLDFLHRKLDRAAFAHVDRFVAICELDRDFIVREKLLPPEHTSVVEPGLDREFLDALSAPLEQREHAIAFTGSWVPRKDPETIVAVIEPLLRADPLLSFRLFGAPGAEPAIRAAFAPEVQTQLHLAPKLTNRDLAASLARCKVFFFPSRYEGYGMAIAEAMACGCAVVATPTGLGGSLRDRAEAILCPVGDRDAMSSALGELLADETRRLNLANAGRRRVANLSWREQCDKLNELYVGFPQHEPKALECGSLLPLWTRGRSR